MLFYSICDIIPLYMDIGSPKIPGIYISIADLSETQKSIEPSLPVPNFQPHLYLYRRHALT